MIGPPETMREHIVAGEERKLEKVSRLHTCDISIYLDINLHIVAGANAMKSGNWKKCRDYILDIKVY